MNSIIIAKAKKMRFSLLFSIFIISAGHTVTAQTKYDMNAPIGMISKMVVAGEDSDRIVLYLSIALKADRINIGNLRFNFFTASSYDFAANTEPVKCLDSTMLYSNEEGVHLRFTFAKSELRENLRVEVFNYLDGTQADMICQANAAVPLMLFTPSGEPVTSTFTAADSVVSEDPEPVTCFYYGTAFDAARPPMTTESAGYSKTLDRDSTFTMTGAARLGSAGLYLFQKDTTGSRAYALRVETGQYPRFTQLEELVPPLVYITKEEEYARLAAIGNDKKQFDRFWLDMVKDPERAAAVIRTFYNRVEAANTLFTSFKQGWKTDMGMIYIVMGKPDFVENDGNTEIWNYSKTSQAPGQSYRFIKTSTIFSPDHYVLIRDKKYAQSWYKAINLLRKGIL